AIAPRPASSAVAAKGETGEIQIDVDTAILPPRPEDQVYDPTMPRAPDDAMAYADPRDPSVPRTFSPGQFPEPSDTAEPETAPYDPGEVITAPEGAEGIENDYMRPPTMGERSGMPGVPGIPGLPGDGPGAPVPGALPPVGRTPDNPAPTTAPTLSCYQLAASSAVQDGMRKQERKLGLDFPGRGPIRSAFVSAVYSGGVPHVSSANFALSVSPEGKVTAVSLLGFTGGSASSWRKVKQAAEAQLKSATLVMKSAFKKGANVGVIVRSNKRTPGGGTNREGATFSFDVTDIGAKDVRVVSAIVSPSPVK
ncbi:MAG: hypothetical protein RIF41_31495, partial [Polyangiaceae bacterium]